MPATRQSWSNLQPLPAQRALLYLPREFTEQEYERICCGLIPECMEDKWFIFVEGNTLYVHRSWTGYCIYQLSFSSEDTKYTVSDVFVNRDASQYSWVDDRYDEKLLLFLINRLLLGGHSPFPIAAHVPAGIATELHFHHVVGAGQRAEEMPKEITLFGILRWLWQWLRWLIKS